MASRAHQSARAEAQSDISVQRIALAAKLKASGFTDEQIMDVAALAQNTELFTAVCTRYENDCETEMSDEEIEQMLLNIYGTQRPMSHALNDNKALVDTMFEEKEYGSKARMLNCFQYLSGSKQWDRTFDEGWKRQLEEEDIVTATAQVTTAYPHLKYLEDARFEQQSKIDRALKLADLADEILVGREMGQQVPKVPIIYPEVFYSGFGNLYGLGKGMVKYISTIRRAPDGLHERIVEVTELRPNDYLYVEDADDIERALDRGYHKYATTNPHLFDPRRSVRDQARGWHLATYVPREKPRPAYRAPAPRVSSAPAFDLAAAVAQMKIKTANYKDGVDMSKVVEKAAEVHPVPAEPEQPIPAPRKKAPEAPRDLEGEQSYAAQEAEELEDKCAAPNLALNMYHLLKTGPGKTYYLSRKHKGLYIRAFHSMKRHPGSAKREAKVAPNEPVADFIPEPPMRHHPVSGNEELEAVAEVLKLKLTGVQLLKNKLLADGDLTAFERIKGKAKSTIIKEVREYAGVEATEEGLVSAIVASVKGRDKHATIGVLRIAASKLAPMYSRTPDGIYQTF